MVTGQGGCRVNITDTVTGCQKLKQFVDAQTVPTTYMLGPGTFDCPKLGNRGVEISTGKDVVIQGQGNTSTVLDLNQLGRLAYVSGGSFELRNLKVQKGKVRMACVPAWRCGGVCVRVCLRGV